MKHKFSLFLLIFLMSYSCRKSIQTVIFEDQRETSGPAGDHFEVTSKNDKGDSTNSFLNTRYNLGFHLPPSLKVDFDYFFFDNGNRYINIKGSSFYLIVNTASTGK